MRKFVSLLLLLAVPVCLGNIINPGGGGGAANIAVTTAPLKGDGAGGAVGQEEGVDIITPTGTPGAGKLPRTTSLTTARWEYPNVVKTTAANYTVGTTNDLEPYAGVIYVTAAAVITLPAIQNGMSVSVITRGDVAVSVDPNASDLIDLDGTPLADGHKATNNSATGDIIVCTSLNDGTGWYCTSNSWTDGG